MTPETTSLFPPPRWTADGHALTFVVTSSGVSNLWIQPATREAPRQLTNFKADRIFSFDWSPDGRQLIVARGMLTSDVVLISNYR